MAASRIIYTTGLTLYGNSTGVAGTGTDLVEGTGGNDTLYVGDDTLPFVFIQENASKEVTDPPLCKLGEQHYGELEPGDLFHLSRVHAWDWNNAIPLNKVQALYTATRMVDKFNFIGCKTDSGNPFEFPRSRTGPDGTVYQVGDTAGYAGIPSQIERAVYLIADALVGGRDPQADFESQTVKVETFGPVRTEMATDKGPMQHIANLIPSPSAWALILPFLQISTSFRQNA